MEILIGVGTAIVVFFLWVIAYRQGVKDGKAQKPEHKKPITKQPKPVDETDLTSPYDTILNYSPYEKGGE